MNCDFVYGLPNFFMNRKNCVEIWRARGNASKSGELEYLLKHNENKEKGLETYLEWWECRRNVTMLQTTIKCSNVHCRTLSSVYEKLTAVITSSVRFIDTNLILSKMCIPQLPAVITIYTSKQISITNDIIVMVKP